MTSSATALPADENSVPAPDDIKDTNNPSATVPAPDNMKDTNNLSAIVPDASSTSTGTFTSIDLNQTKHSYVSLSDTSVFYGAQQQVTQSEQSQSNLHKTNDLSTSSNFPTANSKSTPVNRRVSLPDTVKLLSRIGSVRRWGLSTYKYTKQSMLEKFGKTTKTIDTELEMQIERLKETKRRYENMLILARAWQNHFAQLMYTQRALNETFSELQQRSVDLSDEFSYNAETQRLLAKNGESVLSAINYFISTLNTLCTKTMEDTMDTIRLYETTRVEYDAYRNDYETLQKSCRTDSNINELSKTQSDYQLQKERYEKLKSDVSIKIKFLEENRTKVMRKQLLLFHNAIASYFSGNQEALESTLLQFNLKITLADGNGSTETDGKKSFLEQN